MIRSSCPMLACSLLFSANTESHRESLAKGVGLAVGVPGFKSLQ